MEKPFFFSLTIAVIIGVFVCAYYTPYKADDCVIVEIPAKKCYYKEEKWILRLEAHVIGKNTRESGKLLILCDYGCKHCDLMYAINTTHKCYVSLSGIKF